MEKDKIQIIQKIMKAENLLSLYCLGTNMPYVECNEETFNDQVFVFETQELMQEFAKTYAEKKIAFRGTLFPVKDRLKYFSTLITMNIDEIVYIDGAGRHVLNVSDIVRKQDYSNRPKEQRPVENPLLQLAGIYFMQEMTRGVPNEQKNNVAGLEEELAVNMTKANYLLAVELLEGDETEAEKLKTNKFRIPLMKTQKGDTFQPIFTDPVEFSKFNRENKLRAIAAPFKNLDKMLVKDASAFMLNPGGFHITMTKELISGLKVRFGIEA